MITPARRIPGPPGSPADRVAGIVGPQLLRPVLLQRPRPHRRHLRHHRASATTPNLGRQGRVRAGRGEADEHQTAVHLSDAIDQDRLNQHVGGYRVEVTEPLHKLRIVARRDRGHRRRPHLGRVCSTSCRSSGTSCGRATGSPSTPSGSRRSARGAGSSSIDGETITVDPATWIGTPRPVLGHPADRRGRARRAAGRPAVRGHVVALRADGVRRLRDRAHHPGGRRSGFRSLNDCTRIWKDGRVEQLGWPRVEDPLPLRAPASRPARPSRPPPPTASPVTSTSSPNCRCRSTSAAATAATPTGSTACGRARSSPSALTYDMTDPAIVGRAAFGVIDHVGRAVCPRPTGRSRRAGACSSTARCGRHDPSGFADWGAVAP